MRPQLGGFTNAILRLSVPSVRRSRAAAARNASRSKEATVAGAAAPITRNSPRLRTTTSSATPENGRKARPTSSKHRVMGRGKAGPDHPAHCHLYSVRIHTATGKAIAAISHVTGGRAVFRDLARRPPFSSVLFRVLDQPRQEVGARDASPRLAYKSDDGCIQHLASGPAADGNSQRCRRASPLLPRAWRSEVHGPCSD